MSTLTRREFMKAFGVGLASLIIASCRSSKVKQSPINKPTKTLTPVRVEIITCYATPANDLKKFTPTAIFLSPTESSKTPTPERLETITCYEITPTTDLKEFTPAVIILSPRNQLRACWLSFNELAEKTKSGENFIAASSDINPFGKQLINDHRLALDKLVTAGQIEPGVADLVQEAYVAAVYHVWRSNVPITCYEPRRVDYAPASADQLVLQTTILYDMAARAEINPETVANVQKAIQHDLAFEALSQAEVDALYKKLLDDYQQNKIAIPDFDKVALVETPEMEAAAKFLVELLGEK